MSETRELHRKIDRCQRSLRVVGHADAVRRLHAMIQTAETRLAEIEREQAEEGANKVQALSD